MDIVKMKCLVPAGYGIYQGQFLAENYPEMIGDEESLKILLDGPENPEYEETLKYVIDSYSYDREFLTYSEGAPDILLCTPDAEAECVIMGLAEAGNKIARELQECPEWKTREDIIWECADSDFNTPEARAECQQIREALA